MMRSNTLGLILTIVLTNRTDRSIRIYNPQVYLGKMLVISDSEGHFVRRGINVKYQQLRFQLEITELIAIPANEFPVLVFGHFLMIPLVVLHGQSHHYAGKMEDGKKRWGG